MKKILLFTGLFFCSLLAQAQLNLNLVGTYDMNGEESSDIWGYVAPDGTEYAIVGGNSGTAVVDISTPASPVLREYIPGVSSTWRDIKSYGEYVYVVADVGADGLLIIDMTTHDQAGALNHTFWQPSITIDSVTNTLTKSHNLYIDENGVAYIAGSTINNGGMLFVDVATDPMNPTFLGAGPDEYSHDVFVRNDTMWSSDVNAGYFSVVDVSDKSNPVIMGTQETPFFFTHNTWLSDDGKTLFTTDERGDAPIGAYDVSDLNDIKYISEFRPLATVGKGVIPHNVYVKGDFLVISYYTDGIIIVDASDPSNMVEVGNYDTFSGDDGGFFGAWGAYPFLPSGLVLVSDINTGLYVFQPNYVNAAVLEGLVTNADDNQPIEGATITIETTTTTTNSNASGNYKTGYAVAGTYDVTFQKPTFEPKTISVSLTNGQTTVVDAALTPLTPFAMSGKLVDMDTGDPIPNGIVKIANSGLSFDATTDAQGLFQLPTFYEGNDYTVLAGKWGHKTKELLNQDFSPTNDYIEIQLEEGIQDEFALDLGWTISGDAVTGVWERGEPADPQFPIVPSSDVDFDLGEDCYLTENSADFFGGNVSGGATILTSPEFDLTGYVNPSINFSAYFFTAVFTGFPPPPGDDSLKVFLENGTDRVLVSVRDESGIPTGWSSTSLLVKDYITPTSTMKIVFEVADPPSSSNDVTEAAIDFFFVEETPSAISNPEISATLTASPNPFNEAINVAYTDLMDTKTATLSVYNILGQPVQRIELVQAEGLLSLGKNWDAGVYFLRLETIDGNSKTLRLVKQ